MAEIPDTLISIRASDLRSMLTAMEADDSLRWCDTCGAWLECDDEALALTEDFTGCWKAATCNPKWDHLCRSHRGTMIDELKMQEAAAIRQQDKP
ncbi:MULTISPECIES: hypothetical protein [unclassified Mesorhizobium]|uniref:hypothetical protein n=1 Tax=unclassified Mesorhizobium TaxID=325217 RepID=UPI001129271C|nr:MULTISPECIES: hypothetical protein [unclassified Mesorhizobium]TPK59011.1 hypothetical protein FJ551_25695 [Mesorhizobium sp. B2-5-1]TPL06713.1 hypothetical protein FJ944_23070 [Mesorhizobium sp. B2-4-11]